MNSYINYLEIRTKIILMQIIPIVLGGLFLYLIIHFVVRMPGYALAKKFKALGNMNGMQLNQLVSKVGKYSAIRNLPDGGKVCVWQATGYMISLVIDKDDIVLKIGSEVAAK